MKQKHQQAASISNEKKSRNEAKFQLKNSRRDAIAALHAQILRSKSELESSDFLLNIFEYNDIHPLLRKILVILTHTHTGFFYMIVNIV